MNTTPFEKLVDQVRSEEAVPPAAAPDLLPLAHAQARTRRRALIAVAAVATVAVVGGAALLPKQLHGNDRPAGATDSGTQGQSDSPSELTEHGGPCPETLPTSNEGDDIAGTTRPATTAPDFPTPDAVWLCEYGSEILEYTDSGAVFSWISQGVPRSLTPKTVQSSGLLADITVVTHPDPGCTQDLGVRWLLVLAQEGDLTGISVDDFGCRKVRLTSDPFTTAPGDTQTGNIEGVFEGPPNLAAVLQGWWNIPA